MVRKRLRATRSWTGGRLAVGLMLAATVIVFALTAGGASASGTPGVAFGTGAVWNTLTNPGSAPSGFETAGYDDSSWTTATTPFGQPNGVTCVGTLPPGAWNPTVFPVSGTLYLRKTFPLPENAYGLHLLGTVDNNADVYVNGTFLAPTVLSGSCNLNAINRSVTNAGLNLGDDNLVAVKAVDLGVISFFDLQATYGVVEFGHQPTETLELSKIDPAPTVTITNAQGGPVAGANVTVSLQAVAGSGAFTAGSTTTVPTNGSGVATFDHLAVTQPGKYRLVATSDGATVTSADFAVDDLLFGQQPTETQKSVVMSPSPTVTIKDPYGIGIPNKTVKVTLQTINGTGTLAGSPLSAVTDANGVATFTNVKISDVGKYKLVASSDNTSTTSGGFLIANEVNPCNGSCNAHGSVPNNTDVTASAVNAQGSLAVSVFAGIAPPAGVCTGFVPLGAGSFVNILQNGNTLPDTTFIWQLDKSLVKQAGNPGASKFNICIGAEDLLHPDGVGATPWKTKSGGNAVPVLDADLGVVLFWGLAPDCTRHPTGPCVLHRSKTNAGVVKVTGFEPAPWDATVHGG